LRISGHTGILQLIFDEFPDRVFEKASGLKTSMSLLLRHAA
jgi:hypothetical protein